MLQSAWQQHPPVPCLFSSPARGAAGTGPDKAQAAEAAARGVEKERGGRAVRAWPCLLTPDCCLLPMVLYGVSGFARTTRLDRCDAEGRRTGGEW